MDFILKGGNSGDKGGKPGTAGGAGAGDLVKDTDTANFVADVIEASRRAPVIVDMWAPWCGPCRTLGPMIEKLVRQSGGKVRMVKINVDENQQLAAQLRVSSIPAVFAFKNGALVDGFVGALPESQIKAFITRLTGDGGNIIDDALEDAKAMLEEGDVEGAESVYRQILDQDQANVGALAGVLNCFLARGDTATAQELLDKLPANLVAKPELAAIKTRMELAAAAPGQTAVRDLQSQVAANPDDHQARHDLAMAFYAAGDRQKAVDELLEIIRRDRSWNEDGARKQLVKLFDAFGPTDPLTLQSRRRLSSLLFS